MIEGRTVYNVDKGPVGLSMHRLQQKKKKKGGESQHRLDNIAIREQ